jgi:DNA-binding transcriptional LysR family regulator
MDTLRAMQCFVRAVELGSLSAVAREQRTTQPTISKVVAALEASLGVRLLERTTTSLGATEQGKRFYERARRLLDEYAEAVADAQGHTQRPAGFLRIAAPVALGQLRVNGMVLAFQALYPQIQVELVLSDRAVDLVEDGVDLALRIGGPLPLQVIARKVAVSRRFFVASPAYLSSRPRLRSPQDLTEHEYIRFASTASSDGTLQVTNGKQVHLISTEGRYRVNNSMAIRDSLLCNAGVGVVPGWLVQDLVSSGQLVRVLPRWHAPPHELHLLFPSRRYLPVRTRALIDYMADALARAPGCEPVR